MTVLTAKGEVGASSTRRKRRGRTNEVRFSLDHLSIVVFPGANNSFAIPIVAHGGGGNESSSKVDVIG